MNRASSGFLLVFAAVLGGWLYATGRAAAVGAAITGSPGSPAPASPGAGGVSPAPPATGSTGPGGVPVLPPVGQLGRPITVTIPTKSGRGNPVTVSILSSATVAQCVGLMAAGLASAGYSPGEILTMSQQLCQQHLGR